MLAKKPSNGCSPVLRKSAVAWRRFHDVDAVVAACGNGAVEKLSVLTVVPPLLCSLLTAPGVLREQHKSLLCSLSFPCEINKLQSKGGSKA